MIIIQGKVKYKKIEALALENIVDIVVPSIVDVDKNGLLISG